MYEIEAYVQTSPPKNVPQPIPRLNIPENIAIETDVPAAGEQFMISDCMATLNAVTDIPQSEQSRVTAYMQDDSGNSSRRHSEMHNMTVLRNRYGILP